MNILVTCLYDLGSGYETVRQIHALCAESYRRNLRGMDDHVVLTGKELGGRGGPRQIRNYRYSEMLIQVFAQTRELWREGHDILLVDGDTLCVRPTPWPVSDGLRMFNMANARVLFNAFPPEAYLHSGVLHLPPSMDPACWRIGSLLVDWWDYGKWAYNQHVWNAVFWTQDGVDFAEAESYVDPRYCWCAQPEYDNLGVSRSEAYIVHYHETRGLEMCLRRMKRDAKS